MPLFTLFNQIQIGSEVTSKFFYRHAKFCASHQILVIFLAISVILPLCYPAFNTYYLNPVRDFRHTFFWELSSRSHVSRDYFVKKYGTQPSFHVEQVIITNLKKQNMGDEVGVLRKDILSLILNLQEKIMDAFVMCPNLSPIKRYSLSDLCLKPFNNNTCLIHSPLVYWLNNADRLSSDSSILKTLTLKSETSSGMLVPINSVFGNVVYDKKKIISADSVILTYFLKDMEECNESQTMTVWDAIWRKIINDNDTTFCHPDDRIIEINMNNKGEVKHLSFNLEQNDSLEFSTEQILFMLMYLIFSICTLSFGLPNSVKSRFGLFFSIVAHVVVSLIMSLSVCSLFGVTLTFTSLSCIEIMVILTNAIASTPMQLNIEDRIALGLEKVGYNITKMLLSWLLLLLIFSATNIGSIKEFCIFTSIAMIIDYMLQMSFFVAILSIDLERLELEMSYLYSKTDREILPASQTNNYTRRIGSSLVVLIFLASMTNVHNITTDSLSIKSALSNLVDNFIDLPTTHTNITYWESSMNYEFWRIVDLNKKNQFIEIRPTRYLTLSYTTEHDNYDSFRPFGNDLNWKLIYASIKSLAWFFKIFMFPIIGIIIIISFLMGLLLPTDLVIQISGFLKRPRNNDSNEITPTTLSFRNYSTLYDTSPRIVTLRGRHSADVNFLCANLNGVIVTSATDKHITLWDGKQGVPLRKLERYMRRCETCKCDSTGGMKNCISWPVRAMCMNEKLEIAAAGFDDGVVRVWDIKSGQVTFILKSNGNTIDIEDAEQIMSEFNNNDNSAKKRVTCLQIIVPTLNPQNTSKLISDQKIPAILLATYRNSYFREWDLVSGQNTHTIFTNQKGGIDYLFVVDDKKQGYDLDKIHIFTGARDGSVKFWIRTIRDVNNTSVWNLLYTIPSDFGNAITSIAAKMISTKIGIVVTGAIDGEVKIYDYLTGKLIKILSHGTFGKKKLAKENKEQLLFKRQQHKKTDDFFSEQDLSEKDVVSHQDEITNIIIHPCKEESCPCGNTVEAIGFSIITSSLDEKVNFWRLIRNDVDCECLTSQIGEFSINDYDITDAERKISWWDSAVIKFIGFVRQPDGSAIVFLKKNVIGVRHVKNLYMPIKKCHSTEGEWQAWSLDIDELRTLESNEEIDDSGNSDHIEFRVKTIPLVNEDDLIVEEQLKKKKQHESENVMELKGFIRRRRGNSFNNHEQGRVVDFRHRDQKQHLHPDNSRNIGDDDEMNEMLPFAYIRQVVKMGEDGIAIAYGNFVKVILF
ncbi:16064_t:CDS:2 [Dentiscutata heterogama]|uniref:16064_t:CDS:1 n=1 Tax=Dentiscutata heterogama TaxID=1316150 RepID=A0ACA9K833_9GLOM|nr:16064_t:CDS:2 [Dentiscutata heterogama]